MCTPTYKFILLQRCCLELGLLYFGGYGGEASQPETSQPGSRQRPFPELYLVVMVVKPPSQRPASQDQPARIQPETSQPGSRQRPFPELYLVMVVVVVKPRSQPSQPRSQAAALPRALFCDGGGGSEAS